MYSQVLIGTGLKLTDRYIGGSATEEIWIMGRCADKFISNRRQVYRQAVDRCSNLRRQGHSQSVIIFRWVFRQVVKFS